MDPDAVTSPLTGTPPQVPIEDEAPPARVGRYVLAEELGRGGFGVVHAAVDPKLDRRVAIKLLRRRAAVREDALRRLGREARALAALRHPNVVGVFDVGRIGGPWGDGVFIVMELVEGTSLRGWLRAEAREPARILEVLVSAGRGLAAAHAAGIVHRDFKPGNVLVGAEGEVVKVADFGLARAGEDDEPDPETGGTGRSRDSGLEVLTERGVVMGTPPYMAPEQLTGGHFDARTDQFALCVTAWEALTGELPFPSVRTPDLRAAAIRRGPRLEDRSLPPSVERALRRGLAFDPSDRHPSVEALLEQLVPPRRARRGWLVVGTTSAVVLGLGAWWLTRPTPIACASPETRLAGVWDDATRDEVLEAHARTELTYATEAASRLVARVDAHVDRWSDAWRRTCEALTSSGASRELDRQQGCLREQLARLSALGEVLVQPDAAMVRRGPALVETLGDPLACERALDAFDDGLPPEQRKVAEAVRATLAKARLLAEAGRFDDALADIEKARARQGTVVGLELEVEAEHGVVLDRAGRYDEAADTMSTAYFAASDAGRPRLAARLATELVVVHGYRRGDSEEGLRWARHADTDLQRAGDPPRLRATFHANLGIVHFARGELDEAVGSLTRAVEGLEALGEPGRARLAKVLQNLASVQLVRGERESAITALERSLEHTRSTLGPGHPDNATILGNLGYAYARGGDLEDALAHQQQALEIATRALGPEHPITLTTASNVGERLVSVGRAPEAVPLLETTLEARRRVLGPEHRDVGVTLNNLGLALDRSGRSADAIPRLSRSVELHRGLAGPAPADVAASLHNLGEAQLHLGRLDDAERSLSEALQLLGDALGPEHPSLAFPLTGLGELALARDDAPTALPLLERAHRLRRAHPIATDRAQTAFALARALDATEPGSARAVELATIAADELRRAGPGFAERLAEVERWRDEATARSR